MQMTTADRPNPNPPEPARHTPGKLELWDGCSWRRFGSAQTGAVVCQPVVAPDGHPDLHFPNEGQDGPDAHRMLDCWNALEGLNPSAVGELVEAARWAFDALDNELLIGGELIEARTKLRSALANLRGEIE